MDTKNNLIMIHQEIKKLINLNFEDLGISIDSTSINDKRTIFKLLHKKSI